MIYSGIGSREAESYPQIINLLHSIGYILGDRGWTLRSGHASGSDIAFEKGHVGPKEIYLPWKGFEGSNSGYYNIPIRAFQEAESIHPDWNELGIGSKKLHARDIQQVGGENLDNLSNIVICWTLGGKDIGGTRTAIIFARKNKVPVINLGSRRFQDWTASDVIDLVYSELNIKI